ncbi:hypothetical protein Hanom_Chr07g00579731 [Helianthus anomalus]
MLPFLLSDLVIMRTRRKYRSWRVSEILKTFDAAEALLLLGGPVAEVAAGSGGFLCTVPFPHTGEHFAPLRTRVDNDEGFIRLSENVLTQGFPADWRSRCTVVYKQRRNDRSSETPAGTQMTSAVGDGTEWIVDPHPLELYGEPLHTSVEVLAMFPGV